MADKKISIALSAVDKFSKPFHNAMQTAGKLESQVEQTNSVNVHSTPLFNPIHSSPKLDSVFISSSIMESTS